MKTRQQKTVGGQRSRREQQQSPKHSNQPQTSTPTNMANGELTGQFSFQQPESLPGYTWAITTSNSNIAPLVVPPSPYEATAPITPASSQTTSTSPVTSTSPYSSTPPSTLASSAESSSSSKKQWIKTSQPVDANGNIRGRGFTGNRRGRPTGAPNKKKRPKDNLPKEPKKKGRPKKARNKVKKALALRPARRRQASKSSAAVATPAAPAQIQTLAEPACTVPVGHIPASDIPQGFDYDAGVNQTAEEDPLMNGNFANMLRSYNQAHQHPPTSTPPNAAHPEPSPSALPEDFMTPMSVDFPPPEDPSPNFLFGEYQAQPELGTGFEYPDPTRSSDVFVDGNGRAFTYDGGNNLGAPSPYYSLTLPSYDPDGEIAAFGSSILPHVQPFDCKLTDADYTFVDEPNTLSLDDEQAFALTDNFLETALTTADESSLPIDPAVLDTPLPFRPAPAPAAPLPQQDDNSPVESHGASPPAAPLQQQDNNNPADFYGASPPAPPQQQDNTFIPANSHEAWSPAPLQQQDDTFIPADSYGASPPALPQQQEDTIIPADSQNASSPSAPSQQQDDTNRPADFQEDLSPAAALEQQDYNGPAGSYDFSSSRLDEIKDTTELDQWLQDWVLQE